MEHLNYLLNNSAFILGLISGTAVGMILMFVLYMTQDVMMEKKWAKFIHDEVMLRCELKKISKAKS